MLIHLLSFNVHPIVEVNCPKSRVDMYLLWYSLLCMYNSTNKTGLYAQSLNKYTVPAWRAQQLSAMLLFEGIVT